MERKAISKKIRFEVFKRDKFTCQYCGRKAPDVVLNVDHITPVAKGGTNDILNLVTSCFDCNNGKRAVPIEQSVVLDKQRKQLEKLQERREQIEMMFEWKQSLEDLSDYSTTLLVQYIESLIQPHTIDENSIKTVKKHIGKFGLREVLEAVDISAKQYIKYDTENNVTASSVGDFFQKIGGIASNRRKTPIEQKVGYIAAICKNRFNYWDTRKGMTILTNYVSSLRNYGWDESQIIEDLESEAKDLAKTAKHWSEWKNTMESWTEQVNNWEKDEDDSEEAKIDKIELEIGDIERMSKEMMDELEDMLTLMEYVTVPFNVDTPKTTPLLIANIRLYVHNQIDTLLNEPDKIETWKPTYSFLQKLRFFDCVATNEDNLSSLTFRLNDMYTEYILTTVSQVFFLDNIEISNEKDLMIFKHFFERDLISLCKQKSIEVVWKE